MKAYAFDFDHAIGADIRAARAGLVIDAVTTATANSWPTPPATECDDSIPAGGNGLAIRHSDGTVSTYAHLKHGAIKVQPGAWVAQGQSIAQSGNTGCSATPHCHFEVFLSGTSFAALGPTIPILIETAPGLAVRPKAGDPVVPNNTVLRQDGWRWCHKCQGLFFGGVPNAGTTGGVCPVDRQPHSRQGSGSYILNLQIVREGDQPGWRWCRRCQGLFFAGAGSSCPAGRTHRDSGGQYVLAFDTADVPAQSNWRFCHKCRGLFFGGVPNAGAVGGRCPKDGGAHSAVQSGNYVLVLDQGIEASELYQPGWRFCGACLGLFFAPNPVSHCPVGGRHVNAGNSYVMGYSSPGAPGQEPGAGHAQSHWRWCRKCQGLFFGGRPLAGPQLGRCPADQGPHSPDASGDYRLFNDAPVFKSGTTAPGQDDWRCCSKCQGLFFGGVAGGGVCPVDKQPHDRSHSGNYTVLTATD